MRSDTDPYGEIGRAFGCLFFLIATIGFGWWAWRLYVRQWGMESLVAGIVAGVMVIGMLWCYFSGDSPQNQAERGP